MTQGTCTMPKRTASTCGRRRRSARILVATLVGVVAAALALLTVLNWSPPAFAQADDWQALREQIRHLRGAQDFVGARTLAQQYLGAHTQLDQARQAIQYEDAATLYVEGRHAEALQAFQALPQEYAHLVLDPAGTAAKVDDAQFFVGVLHDMSGERQAAYAAYMTVVDTWPGSNRAAEALKAANVVLHGLERDAAEGGVELVDNESRILANVQRLITQFPNEPKAGEALLDLIGYYSARPDWKPDAAIGLADHLQTVLTEIRKFPAGQTYLPAAIQRVNKALMWQEHAECFQPGVRVRPFADDDHAAIIGGNIASLMQDCPLGPQSVEAAAEYAEYLLDRAWRGGTDGAALEGELQILRDYARAAAPDTEQTWLVDAHLAEAIARTDPPRAVAHWDALIKEATLRGWASCAFNAELGEARALSLAGREAEARATWRQQLVAIRNGSSPLEPGSGIAAQIEAELRNFVAHSYVAIEGDSWRAIADFEAIAADERLPDHCRAISLYHKAFELRRLHRTDEIPAVIAEILARFPNTAIAQQLAQQAAQ